MKRYQCIKNVYEAPYDTLIFKAGQNYNEANSILAGSMEMIAIIDLKDQVQHFSLDFLQKHFKELEPAQDLPIPAAYWDIESAEYVAFNQTGGCAAMVWSIIAIAILTVLALIFFR